MLNNVPHNQHIFTAYNVYSWLGIKRTNDEQWNNESDNKSCLTALYVKKLCCF